MTSDAEIVERLREQAQAERDYQDNGAVNINEPFQWMVMLKAADSITRLSARVEELERALADAIEGWEEGAQYKGEYLRKKHHDDEGISKARSLLSPRNG